MEFDVLYVVVGTRGEYPAQDLCRALTWASGEQTFRILVVFPPTGEFFLQLPEATGEVFRSPLAPTAASGFHAAAGLQYAQSRGWRFRHAVIVQDSCLILRRQFVPMITEKLTESALFAVGVRAPIRDVVWQAAQVPLMEWKLPTGDWEHAPPALCPDILLLPEEAVRTLSEEGRLVPQDCQRWPGHYGEYLSWVIHMTGRYVVHWGTTLRPLPPLFVVRGCGGQGTAPPHALSDMWGVFSPVGDVLSYGERELRAMFARFRGEESEEIMPWRPVVTGPERIEQAEG